MVIERLRKPKQHLQKAMHVRRRNEIEPARNMADALARVVDDDCEVVAGWYILSHDNDVAPAFRLGADLAERAAIRPELGEGESSIASHFPRQSDCPFHI
jgi:hypothetical protein